MLTLKHGTDETNKYLIYNEIMLNISMARIFNTSITLLFVCFLSNFSIADENRVGGEFNLTTHLNEPYSSTDSLGKVILVFFGFTHCPDVCPNTLGTVQSALNQLGAQAERVQPLFISVDPKRDTPEILNNYLKYFGNNFIGLTGSSDEIDKVIEQFQAFYSFEGSVTDGNYSVDHTSNLYIINTVGEVSNIIPHGLPAEFITEKIQKQLDETST